MPRFSYEYPRAALAVDCVVFGHDDEGLRVLLIQRGAPPFERAWALPGGFVRMDETLDQAARRELTEETGVSRLYIEQLYTFSALDRDPRERVVSVAYFALVKLSDHSIRAATDASDAGSAAAANCYRLFPSRHASANLSSSSVIVRRLRSMYPITRASASGYS